VLQRSAEPIQPPADDDVEPATAGFSHEAIKCRPAVLRAADALVDVCGGRPAARLRVAPEFGELVLRLLVERRDARVDRGSQIASGSDVPGRQTLISDREYPIG
jgi:hypothetical protein